MHFSRSNAHCILCLSSILIFIPFEACGNNDVKKFITYTRQHVFSVYNMCVCAYVNINQKQPFYSSENKYKEGWENREILLTYKICCVKCDQKKESRSIYHIIGYDWYLSYNWIIKPLLIFSTEIATKLQTILHIRLVIMRSNRIWKVFCEGLWI